MQILGVSAFDKTPIEELLTEIKDNQNVKEQYNLFNVDFNASVVFFNIQSNYKVLSMKIVTFKGGLGNQIFQYAFYLYLKRQVKSKIYGYYNKNWLNGHNGLEIQNIFEIKLPKSSLFSNLIAFFIRLLNFFTKRNYFISSDQTVKMESIYFDGWWQDKKYYQGLGNWLTFRDFQLDEQNSCILEEITNSDSISVHIRRGDYLEDHFAQKYGNICTISYYNEAIKLMKNNFSNPKFFIFSDDIEWAKNNLCVENRIYVSINTDRKSFLDMYLMSRCKANIMANSTFSYWGAFLNKNSIMVVYPKKWYNSKYLAPNIFNDNWIGI